MAEEQANAAGEAPKEEKKKKIAKMTLAEIDAALQKVKTTMGGTESQYAQQLLKRKSEISQ